MRAVIIYRSQTGFTQQYALWLAEALHCEAVPYGRRGEVDFALYDVVIYGSWLHAGRIRGVKWFQKQLPRLTGKRLAVFAVGASPARDPGVETALAANLPAPQWEGVARFYLQGGLRYERMGLVDRLLMAGLRRMLRKKEGPDSPTLQGVSSSFEAQDRTALDPILRWAGEE